MIFDHFDCFDICIIAETSRERAKNIKNDIYIQI